MERKAQVKRIGYVLNIFLKHGFGYLFKDSRFFKKKYEYQQNELNRGKRFRMALEELGTTYIKIGQMLANRPDLLPADVIDELKGLQEDVTPFPFEQVKKILSDQGIIHLFDFIDEKPLATASIGQVHIGIIKGQKVAIKVKRPMIDAIVKTDLEIIKKVAVIFDKYSNVRNMISFSRIVDNLAVALLKEIDFKNEAFNIKRFRTLIKDKDLVIPEVYDDLYSDKILVTKYIEGKTLNMINFEYMPYEKRHVIGQKLIDIYFKQIFDIGVYHADPHPGNIIVTDDYKIAFIDFGNVGRLTKYDKENLSNLMIGIVIGDKHLTINALKGFGMVDSKTNIEHIYTEIDKVVNEYVDIPLRSIKITDIFLKVFRIAFENKLKIPEHLSTLARTLSTLEGNISMIDAELNIFEVLKSHASKMLFEQKTKILKPTNLLKVFFQFAKVFAEFPDRFEILSSKVINDELKLNIEIKDSEKIMNRLEKLFNKISMALILLSLSIIIAGATVGGLLSPEIYKTYFSKWYLWVLRLGILTLVVLIIILLFMIIKKEKE